MVDLKISSNRKGSALKFDSKYITANDRSLFNRIASSYVRKDLVPAPQRARRFRLMQTLDALPCGTDIDLLEVGCGAGFAAVYLQELYGHYLGIDHSELLIRYAQALHAGPKVRFQVADIRRFSPLHQFDVVLSIGVLHHLEAEVPALERMVQWLKPGGWLVVNEPQSANPVLQVARRLRKHLDPSYSTDQHTYTGIELIRFLKGAGLEQVFVRPQGFFSTPFAEVVMPVGAIANPLSKLACRIDRWLEGNFQIALGRISWNSIAGGRRSVCMP